MSDSEDIPPPADPDQSEEYAEIVRHRVAHVFARRLQEVEGSVATSDTGSITIQPGDNASAVIFAIPDGFTLPEGLVDGSVVEARGELVNGVLTLTKLELQDQGDDATGDGGGGGSGDG